MLERQKHIVVQPLVVFIVAASVGFLLGRFSPGGNVSLSGSVSKVPQTNSLFRSQTATFQGMITKVNKGSIDVKTDSGQTGSFALSEKVNIYKFKEGSRQSSTSSDLSSIETGKKVLIILALSGNQYKVVTLSYQPSVAPKSTATPQVSN